MRKSWRTLNLGFSVKPLQEVNMDGRPSPSSLETHFVDIHEVLPKEKEGSMTDNKDKPPKKPNKFRDMKRTHRSFSRQVSLETGFSVLNGESKTKDERRVLRRSGRSFGGFGTTNRVGGDGRKGDFSIFMTKSSLTKQNSSLPFKKEGDSDFQKHDGSGIDDSVPAGRYFAALRGPELDEVKVLYSPLHMY